MCRTTLELTRMKHIKVKDGKEEVFKLIDNCYAKRLEYELCTRLRWIDNEILIQQKEEPFLDFNHLAYKMFAT